MGMIGAEEISRISGDSPDLLAELDSRGFLLSPGETVSEFKERIAKIADSVGAIERALEGGREFDLEGICRLNGADMITPGIMSEASQATRDEYGFELDWAPGFFMSRSLGPLWGGCAILIPEACTTVFLIRSVFRKKRRWLFYRRDELLAHELCHSARMPVGDRIYDENFAYRISPSALRRKFGGCFRHEADAILFIAPVFLLLAVQLAVTFTSLRLPIFPFWILALAYPCFLLARNHIAARTLSRAASNLEACGVSKPYAVLFRCTAEEIAKIADIGGSRDKIQQWMRGMAASEARWRIILLRFIPGSPTEWQDKTDQRTIS